MREIKFRGKNSKEGWVYGSLEYNPHSDEAYITRFTLIDHDGVDYGEDYWLVDPETVGQFTGLFDKNGKEIFEGDIVLSNVGYGEFNAEVKTAEVFKGGWYPFCQGANPNKNEVIGKIYENPELIK